MYDLIFDISTYGHPLFDFGGPDIAFLVVGALLLLGLRKRYPEQVSMKRIMPMAIVMIVFSIAGNLFFGYMARSSYDSVREMYRAGECRGVEGPVRGVSLEYGRISRQSFTVGGTLFTISDNEITGGYNVTVHRGGPLREGVPVKIVYCERYGERVIARLEVKR